MTTFARKSSLVFNAFINTSKYDLNRESDRLATFIDGGYSNEFVKAEDLALFGFYFYKRPDTVKCAFCGVLVEDFEDGDEALGAHLKFSPNCPLLEKRRPTENIPLDENIFKQRAPPVSNYDECGSKNLNHHKFQYPQFRLPHKRMKTFETWPVGIEQKPKELVEAGFFYSGQSDLVVCFACGLYLNQWENGDNPWVEHKKLATTECEHLLLNQATVTEEEQKFEEFKKFRETEEKITTMEITENAQKDGMSSPNESDLESICKICLDRKSKIIFLPCSHVAVCGVCVSGIENCCPICRSEIKQKHNVFYS